MKKITKKAKEVKTAKQVNVVDTVSDITKELLNLMGSKADFGVEEDKENEAIVVNIKTEEETGLLIGHHGDTLASLQAALGMIVKQKTGEWVRIVVNVGDWREKQETHLRELADEAAERVKQTGHPQPIYNLTPAQRRIVHMELSKNPEITSESTGEGEERYLVVSPKKA